MSRCPICELKPMNCDCTPEAKELFWLKESIEESQDAEIEDAEKRGAERMLEAFAQVAGQDAKVMLTQGYVERCWGLYERLKGQNK